MISLKNISKKYVTGDLVQNALNDVSLDLRDNEFVAILGPSGSGKTTLLNILGGLNRFDSGDLIINGISTKKYKSRDWDAYRNHSVGFVFQSYNLIPHQSVLSNVELALTISGVSKKERRERAKAALDKVGLSGQYHKKPNQMSGGQMQRVAIARALINNPDILLADEPTGALDSETSVQVMELLKEVAGDRLVVMVTHNPELAKEYANRIVKLSDGKITDDTNPYKAEEVKAAAKPGKSKMSFLTALSLSFNNLVTKKARTILTSFAGSIGIIGIALILSLSAGVNAYIENIQKDTMTSYPITIEKKTVDLGNLMNLSNEAKEDPEHPMDKVYTNNVGLKLAGSMTSSVTENNLTDFMDYLSNKDADIYDYVGENGIVYSYDTKFSVFAYDSKGKFINTDGSTINKRKQSMSGMYNLSDYSSINLGYFDEIMTDGNGNISSAVKENYTLLKGNYPENYDEAVLVLDSNNELSTVAMYELGFLDSNNYKELLEKLEKGENPELPELSLTYDEILSKEFYLLPAFMTYEKDKNGNFKSFADDMAKTEEAAKKAIKLKLSDIIKPSEKGGNRLITAHVCYTKALTDKLIADTEQSEIVVAQKASKDKNVLNGMTFAPDDENQKIKDAKKYLKELSVSEKAAMATGIVKTMYADNEMMLNNILSQDETVLAGILDNYLQNPDRDTLLKIYDTYVTPGSYEDNMETFGVVSYNAPKTISIYADKFENKDKIAECIQKYNESATEENKITYTDYVGLLMSSITTIINVITYVLVAFVAVSLVVSSIMIGIITYISVLERTKEIGVLRAIGASKHNISSVFNAETFIVGLLSGIIGVGLSELILIPGNAVIHHFAENNDINAIIPVPAIFILIALSVVLTLIGGIIPSKKAAKMDPVNALRSE